MEEARATGRFFQAARGLLNGAQSQALSYGRYARRSRADPMGAGFLWARMDYTIKAVDRAGLARALAAQLVGELHLDQGQATRLQPMVQAWAQSLPQRWLDIAPDNMDRVGSYEMDRIEAMAEPFLQLLRDMWNGLGLRAAQRQKLLGLRRLPVAFLGR